MSRGVRAILIVFVLVVAIAVLAAILVGPRGRRGDEEGEGRRAPPAGLELAAVEGQAFVVLRDGVDERR